MTRLVSILVKTGVAFSLLCIAACSFRPKPPQIETSAAMQSDIAAGAQFDPDEFLRLINDYRAQNGLKPLHLDPVLMRLAQSYASEIAAANLMTHDLEPYGSIVTRFPQAGYAFREAAENLGEGQHSTLAIFNAWRKSPEHDANMRLPEVTDLGIAYAINPASKYRIFWVLEMGSRRTFISTLTGGIVPLPLAILK